MIFTTTPSVEGKAITRYHGVIAGEAIMGVNIFKDLFAGIRDIIGGRAGVLMKRSWKKPAPSLLRISAPKPVKWAPTPSLGLT